MRWLRACVRWLRARIEPEPLLIDQWRGVQATPIVINGESRHPVLSVRFTRSKKESD